MDVESVGYCAGVTFTVLHVKVTACVKNYSLETSTLHLIHNEQGTERWPLSQIKFCGRGPFAVRQIFFLTIIHPFTFHSEMFLSVSN